MAVRHHDGCFGCGQANLFGLQLENGRVFVKQDHQGPDGSAHPGIVVTALLEALSLTGAEPSEFRVEVIAPVPVGEFVELHVSDGEATAMAGGVVVARLA